MLDLAIRGGDVVAPQGTGRWSLGVKDGKIAFVGLENQAVQAAKGDRRDWQTGSARRNRAAYASGRPNHDATGRSGAFRTRSGRGHTRDGVWGHDHAHRLRLGASQKRRGKRDRTPDESLEE